jgi:hypothetical protein
MDFSFWGFVKDNVYTPPMAVDLQELRDRIVNAIALLRHFIGQTVGQIRIFSGCLLHNQRQQY